MPPTKVLGKMKWCNQCQRFLPFESFSKNRKTATGYDTFCKECVNAAAPKYYPARNQRRQQYKMQLVIRFGNRCAHCGAENLPICCYQFHHAEKNGESNIAVLISNSANGTQEEALEEELKKVIMVCANCHHILHWGAETAKTV